MEPNPSFRDMKPEEKKRALYLQQKELLDTFLSRRAISQKQYEKSLGDLTRKMGMETEAEKDKGQT